MNTDPLYAVPGLSCTCGCEAFARVVVERVIGRPVVTDLVACDECRLVYHVPLPPPAPVVLPPGHGRGFGEPDSNEALKRDAAEAAKDYRKPGRSGRLGPGGRR